MNSTPQYTAMQGIALLTLCRFAAFLTDSAGYTAPLALGTFLAVCSQILLAVCLLKMRPLRVPRPLSAIAAVLWAGTLCLRLHRLLTVLHAPVPTVTLALMLVTVYLLLRHPPAATARAAALLLIVTAAGLLLLPVSGIGTAEPVFLHLRDSVSEGFLRAWAISGDMLLLLPVLRRAESKAAAHTILTGWGIGCGIILPGIILLGTMQNGRLRDFGGAPFFLMLSRTPLSDAVRTDGFWLLLAVGLTALSAVFLIESTKPMQNDYASPSHRRFICRK